MLCALAGQGTPEALSAVRDALDPQKGRPRLFALGGCRQGQTIHVMILS